MTEHLTNNFVFTHIFPFSPILLVKKNSELTYISVALNALHKKKEFLARCNMRISTIFAIWAILDYKIANVVVTVVLDIKEKIDLTILAKYDDVE